MLEVALFTADIEFMDGIGDTEDIEPSTAEDEALDE